MKKEKNKSFNFLKNSSISIKLPLTVQLFILFNDKVNPIIIIEYIVKNLYSLIEESYVVEKLCEIFHKDLDEIYSNYYKNRIIKKNWLKTLFPSHIENLILSNLYIGIAGRLAFFSGKPSNEKRMAERYPTGYNIDGTSVFYWYSDPVDWSRSWYMSFDSLMELVWIRSCNFSIVDRFDSTKIKKFFYWVPLIIYKKNWYEDRWDDEESKKIINLSLLKPELDIDCNRLFDKYSYQKIKENLIPRIDQYKKNVNRKYSNNYLNHCGYDEELDKIFNTITKEEKKIFTMYSNSKLFEVLFNEKKKIEDKLVKLILNWETLTNRYFWRSVIVKRSYERSKKKKEISNNTST